MRPGLRPELHLHDTRMVDGGLIHPHSARTSARIAPRNAAWNAGDTMSSDRFLTYTDAAALLGMTPDSVRQRARREMWKKQISNEGKALVLVPIDAPRYTAGDAPETPGGDTPAVRPAKQSKPTLDIARVMVALEEHIATLRQNVGKAEESVRFERARADDERTRADAERMRADTEHARADELMVNLDGLRDESTGQTERFEQDLAALKAMVDSLKQPRPWWRRLRAG